MKIKKNDKLFKGLLTINVLLVLLIFTTTNVFADFYVIAGSRGVGTKITSLPYTIASSGFYYIDKDLSCVAGDYGITITADNVTLDLMGFSLAGPGGTDGYSGIYMNTRANIEIRNGTVRDFGGYGIFEGGTSSTTAGHRIINIRANGNNQHGINLNGRSHLVEKCTAISNGDYGICVGFSSTVTGSLCSSNGGRGIYADDSSIVKDNTCFKNTGHGIATRHGCNVIGNTCWDNLNGINAEDSCILEDNNCYDNNGDGINGGSGCTVIGNACSGNADDGIDMSGYSVIDQNTARNNTSDNIDSCGDCVFGTNVQ